MPEAIEYIKNKDSGTEIKGFIKKFSKISLSQAKELRKKLEGLDIMKIDEKSISKIIEIFPENEEDLNKIFVGISLDEEETKKVLDTIKEVK